MARAVPSLTLALVLASIPCWSQQNPPAATQNPKAVSIIRESLNVAGGIPATTAIQDYAAVGKITYHLGHEFHGNVAIRGAGLDQLRFDASLAGGIRSEVTNHGDVRLKTEKGSVAVISAEAPLAPSRLILPYLLLAPALGSPGYKISYKGLVHVDGVVAHDIQLQLAIFGFREPDSREAKRFTVDFFIDASTFQILMMQDVVHGQNVREIRYSDYRNEHGVLVPFSITQNGGYQPCSITLSQIIFNSGLRDSDFTLLTKTEQP